ncbi:integrase core domain protein [Leptospira interrogans serovar Grippotyphosa str. LT2186]|uniref:Integrase core domain protein n=2 Tax=Leptospira interrogans TaxID=173 RepID=M3GQS3_LEPIR|nr:integrase core domain protein [Leptospira interrogans serovar Grippotyphosa str. LT2186]
MAIDFPAYGQQRASNELKKQGIIVAPCYGKKCMGSSRFGNFSKKTESIRSVHGPRRFSRINRIAGAGIRKRKLEKQVEGEIETEHPGYLGCQDTYYVGTIKGVGRIYQQTFIDSYSKVAMAKLYDRKNALVAADMLNYKVVPWFEEEGIRLLMILTDRGTEYCGNREHHEFQLFLALEDIDHSKTKARHPQSNGICEQFHRTIQDEFYAIAFRKKVYNSIEDLQKDLDQWIDSYNNERTHQGKYCFCKTPIQTFLDTKELAKNKYLDNLQFS